MRSEELDFELPPELIAQEPILDRSASRLLHYRRDDRSIAHHRFSELPSLLRRGDLLVFNDTRVLPARFLLRKDTGGLVEGLFLSQPRERRWHVMLRNLGNYGSRALNFVNASELLANVIRVGEAGEYEMEVNTNEPAAEVLQRIGRMPLPPYIKRERQHDQRDEIDREHYQTIYARQSGAVAAPTAGLHFTLELMRQLQSSGIERAFVTLHVGLGTFKPITTETLAAHRMHAERYSISSEAAAALNRAKEEGCRIIPAGTTSARVLESQPEDRPFQARSDQTSIFIYPPYRWKHVGAMITNFHLPRSTLIAMIAALVGLEEQRRIYHVAIEQRYRFFSYGDAMFVE